MIMKFRSYSCFYFAYNRKTKELTRNNNSSCWAGYSYYSNYNLKNLKTPKVIYISDYKEWSSVSAHKQMVYIINKITPCREIKIKDKWYIAYRAIGEDVSECYGIDLVLLNYIRTLWNESNGCKDTESFLEDLELYDDSQDPLYFLMELTKEYNTKREYGYNHSNFGQCIIPKNKNYMFEANKNISQMRFMMNKV